MVSSGNKGYAETVPGTVEYQHGCLLLVTPLKGQQNALHRRKSYTRNFTEEREKKYKQIRTSNIWIEVKYVIVNESCSFIK